MPSLPSIAKTSLWTLTVIGSKTKVGVLLAKPGAPGFAIVPLASPS